MTVTGTGEVALGDGSEPGQGQPVWLTLCEPSATHVQAASPRDVSLPASPAIGGDAVTMAWGPRGRAVFGVRVGVWLPG